MPEESWCPLGCDLTARDEQFFELVETCDLSGVEQFLADNRVNINMRNYQGITPLHLAIKHDCEPLVDLFLRQRGKFRNLIVYIRTCFTSRHL
jgi:ankyrin repeat protein